MAEKSEKRILVVDDDKSNRTLCADALAAAGYEVDTTSDGIYALELLSLSAYGLVLTDINMPRLDGIGFYKSAVTRYPDLKDSFLFMTAGIYSKEAWGFLREIGKKCIYKPFKITDLIGCLDNLLTKPPEAALVGDIEEKRREPRFESLTDCEVFDKGVVSMDILPATARE
ncbi:MAG: response regulator, partial [Deltaproteobacteria bacterium]|nr:response regulator [Deltaproteobacteria bacterium]